MELIIKPTGRCNFNCTFCSSHELNITHPGKHVPDKIKELIDNLKPGHIIVTGGEPLTIDPDYYWELQEYSGAHVGFTTNLKDFYLHPEKWTDMFRDAHFGVITSFNYGDCRMWDPQTVFTEEMFRDLYEKFITATDLPFLQFIAVIDYDNEDRFMDHVLLAKDLRTQVKLNPAGKIGLQGYNYPKYKMIRGYLDIIKAGLGEYEMTCCERKKGTCAFNTNFLCNTGIRCCYVDPEGNLHYGICDDEVSDGHELPMDEFPLITKPKLPAREEWVSENCETCDLFRFCNGCNSYRRRAKDFPEHCEEMLKMKDELIEVGWLI